ncbi:OmpH family outer membrane protein [bacterium]|nr:OmpH family outer membrane protein [bacterium]
MTTHKISRLSLALILGCLFLVASARAEGKIGVVDVDQIIARSRTVSEAVKKAEASMKERNDQIQSKISEMQSAQADLERRRSVLSEDQLKSEEAKILKQKEDVEDLQHETNKELARIRQQVMPPEVNRIMEAVREVAKRDGYDLVLPAETVLYSVDRINITPLVIQLLDKGGSGSGSVDESKSDDNSDDSAKSKSSSSKSTKSSTSTRRSRLHLPKNND